jgi:hypothetical protein
MHACVLLLLKLLCASATVSVKHGDDNGYTSGCNVSARCDRQLVRATRSSDYMFTLHLLSTYSTMTEE